MTEILQEVLSIGASGGSRIISGVSYVALRSLHFNEDLQDSTFAPRVHNQLHPNKAFHERGVPEVSASFLYLIRV